MVESVNTKNGLKKDATKLRLYQRPISPVAGLRLQESPTHLKKIEMEKRNPIQAYKRILAKDKDWDWCFLLVLEKKKLQRMRDYLSEARRHVGWEQNVRELNICIRLIDIITEEDSTYKTWIKRRYIGEMKWKKREDGCFELLDAGIDNSVSFPCYINTRNERRFFRDEPIKNARKYGNEGAAQTYSVSLRKLKAMHLYNLIREYKMWEWWD